MVNISASAVKKAAEQEPLRVTLRNIRFFSGLEDTVIDRFISQSYTKELKRGNLIFEYGDPAEQFFVMLRGWVKLYQHNNEGEETVLALATRGDCFSEEAAFDGSGYPYSAQVVGGTARFLVIPIPLIREQVSRHPEVALSMLASLSHHINQLSLNLEYITRLTTAQRVGCFLLKLSMDRNYATTLHLPYNKYLVASRLGMEAESFSRAIRRLQNDLNITLNGREVTLPDIDALQAYCQVECFREEPCGLEKRLACNNSQCDVYRMRRLM